MDTVFISQVDTVIVNVVDTLYFPVQSNIEADTIYATILIPQLIVSIIIALVAVYSGLAARKSASNAEKTLEQSRKVQENAERLLVRSRWTELLNQKNMVWENVKIGYALWLEEIKWEQLPAGERPPKEIVHLLDKGGVPKNIDHITSMEGFWTKLNEDSDPNIVWLHQFFSRVHHPSGYAGSVISTSNLDSKAKSIEFYEARAVVSQALDNWGEIMSMEYLVERFRNQRREILLFAWLELSLYGILGKEWYNTQKLFELASRLDTMHKEKQIDPGK